MAPHRIEGRLLTLISFGLGISLGRLLRQILRRKAQECDGVAIAASGRLIAAWRALESLEPQPLFVDPLAAALAGGDAVREALQTAVPFPALPDVAQHPSSSDSAPGAADAAGGQEAAAATAQPPRRFCVSNVAARVWWFDGQLAAALARPACQPGAQPRQVVVLGAGYDTRPWRLRLPRGLRWFELDLPPVAAAKRQALQELGAALEPSAPGARPLLAASWTPLGADLGQPGWSAALLAAGLDASQPTVWVAEGLLMYLAPDQVGSLLREMAGVSPPGSSLILHQTTSELLGLIGQGAAAYAPFPPQLVATWRSGWPQAADAPALAALLRGAGWPQLVQATSRARIAASIVSELGGGGGDEAAGSDGGAAAAVPSPGRVAEWVDFEARPDEGRDRWAVFVVAGK